MPSFGDLFSMQAGVFVSDRPHLKHTPTGSGDMISDTYVLLPYNSHTNTHMYPILTCQIPLTYHACPPTFVPLTAQAGCRILGVSTCISSDLWTSGIGSQLRWDVIFPIVSPTPPFAMHSLSGLHILRARRSPWASLLR